MMKRMIHLLFCPMFFSALSKTFPQLKISKVIRLTWKHQGHNQEFFRTGEVSPNIGSLINISHSEYMKKGSPKEKHFSFSS